MFRFADKTTGTARSISVYVASHSRAKTLAVGLYTDERGHPGSLLASGSLSAPQTRTWNNVTIKPATVKVGHAYWVAVLAEGGTLYFRDRSHGSCPSESSPKSHLSALPASARKGQRSNTCPISAYVSGKIAVSAGNASHGGDGTRFWRRRSKPTNTLPPSISGTARQGQTLKTSNGSWSNSPSSYSYQWQDCVTTGCSNIAGATGSSYTLAASDVGSAIDVIVTATNSAGSASATSAHTVSVTPLPPSNSALPQLTGTPTQYQTLTTTNGSWTNSPTSYSYQWQDCTTSGCTAISGATGSSYTLTSSDVGDKLDVVVTATNAGGSASATSAQTTSVVPTPPSNTALPVISGTAQQGQTLTTTNGSWSGSPTNYTYQWQDCDSSGANCTNINGATSGTYTLASGDVSHTIRAVVTAVNSGGSTAATSAQTPVVGSSGAPSTPVGVTLQSIDGGTNYFCSQNFTQTCNAGWDSSSFFPIANFDDDANAQSSINAYHALGINVIQAPNYGSVAGPGNTSILQWAAADGMSVIGEEDGGTSATSYPNISFGTAPKTTAVGYVWCDECENTPGTSGKVPNSSLLGETLSATLNCASGIDYTTLQRVKNDMQGALAAGDSSRFTMTNFTSNWVHGQVCFNPAPDVLASTVVSYDEYAITDPWHTPPTYQQAPWAQYTYVNAARAYETAEGVSKPIWFYQEAATPYSGGGTASPPNVAAETWAGIIAGARGVEYFDHNTGTGCGCGYGTISTGPAGSDLLGSSSGGTYSLAQLKSQVTETDGVIKLLSPILNAQSANSYISSAVTGTGNRMDTITKWEPSSSSDARCSNSSTGCFYVFSTPAFNSAQAATYTFKKNTSCPASINAYRLLNDSTLSSPATISVSASGGNCQFSDSIANHSYADSQPENDVVLYVIPNT